MPCGRKSGRKVIEASVDLEPLLVDSDYELAFRRIGGLKRSLVFVLTDLIEPAATQPLLDAVAYLARRHVVVVASVDDPDLLLLAGGPRSVNGDHAAIDVARTRLASDFLNDRDSAARQLRGLGALVVMAPPDRFAASMVDAYLRTKRLARL